MSITKRFLVALSLTAAIALVVAVWMRARALTAGSACAENLRQIGLGLANYESVWKKFPPASLGGHSWRIRCVPLLISSPLYSNYDFEQRWDAEDNMTVDQRPIPYGKGPPEIARTESVQGMPFAYECGSGPGTHSTAFLMVVGPDAFGSPEGGRAAREIIDNLETTIAVAETARRDIHWLHPIDLHTETMSYKVNSGPLSISSSRPDGPLVLFCDGAVFHLQPKTPEATLRAMLTINGGEPLDRAELIRAGFLRTVE